MPIPEENLKGAIALGGQTIKSLELVNGGAAVAILTFYGNATKAGSNIHLGLGLLRAALGAFGFGVLLAVGCSILAYLSQLASATNEPKLNEITLRTFSIVVGLLSATSFLVGLVLAGCSFR